MQLAQNGPAHGENRTPFQASWRDHRAKFLLSFAGTTSEPWPIQNGTRGSLACAKHRDNSTNSQQDTSITPSTSTFLSQSGGYLPGLSSRGATSLDWSSVLSSAIPIEWNWFPTAAPFHQRSPLITPASLHWLPTPVPPPALPPAISPPLIQRGKVSPP